MITTTVTWNDFPESQPPAIFLKGEYVTRTPHFVALVGKQVVPLVWVVRQGQPGHWETFKGDIFHGEVLMWCTSPEAP